ncbi:MAG: hypothetical protein HHAS10_06470 [Candidatus Altimarinota bacterium]
MRSRFIALIILLVLIGGPIFLYWFYYKKNVTSLVLISDSIESFTVSLDGELKYKNFPLLDQVFRYKSTCTGSCYFSPIPPLNYSLRISSNGREDINDTVQLENGEQRKYIVQLPVVFLMQKVGYSQENPESIVPSEYFPVGIGIGNRAIAISDKRDGGELGFFSSGKFIPVYRSKESLLGAYIDLTRSFVIVPNNTAGQQYIYSLESPNFSTKFPYPERIISVAEIDGFLKLQTVNGLYENRGGEWKKNLRFTDYIDYTSRYRIGFISKKAIEKLQIQNIEGDMSVLVLYDREENTINILKRGIEIQGFLLHNGLPGFVNAEGDIYTITLHGI